MAYTTIDKPSDYFNTVLYSGSASSLSVTGVGFQPDLVWIKRRNATANHKVNDSVRGTGLALSIAAAAEIVQTGIASFDSDGFTLGTGSADHNTSGGTYASWNWLGSGTASSNTDGDITSSVSANTTSGFSIVGFTGTGSDGDTVGHGLSQAPELVITKSRTNAHEWYTFGYPNNSIFTQDGSNLRLNSTNAIINSTEHEMSIGSSLITLVDSGQINVASSEYIYYCFHSVKGYSKIGSYTGNGNANGTFVYTGFKPAWVMMKRTDSTNDWFIYDNTRNPFNETNLRISANSTSAESTQTTNQIDILSNGWKCRGSAAATNASGGTYIYMAFAENPFVTSTGIPATAR